MASKLFINLSFMNFHNYTLLNNINFILKNVTIQIFFDILKFKFLINFFIGTFLRIAIIFNYSYSFETTIWTLLNLATFYVKPKLLWKFFSIPADSHINRRSNSNKSRMIENIGKVWKTAHFQTESFWVIENYLKLYYAYILVRGRLSEK